MQACAAYAWVRAGWLGPFASSLQTLPSPLPLFWAWPFPLPLELQRPIHWKVQHLLSISPFCSLQAWVHASAQCSAGIHAGQCQQHGWGPALHQDKDCLGG